MRKITSLTLVIAGFIEIITSVVLYVMPAGRVAYWADYRLLGLSKIQWDNIHVTVGTLFVVMGTLHIFFNWRPITAYLKNKAKDFTVFTKSFNIALLLSLYVTVGTLYSLPPMNSIIELGEYFSSTANEKYGEPPYGHAELSSLKMFCSRMNINIDQANDVLEKTGIKIKDVEQSIGEISKNNALTPQELYNIIKKSKVVPANEGTAFPEAPYPGFGRQTIKDICLVYNLSLAEVLTKLREAGFTVQADDTVKDASRNNKSNPMKIFEIIKEIAR
jgi:hypothetical protein